MATYERQIDALGGVDHKQSDDWNDGYSDALIEAASIGADADQTTAELIETIQEMIDGNFRSLSTWATNAETLLRRINARLS